MIHGKFINIELSQEVIDKSKLFSEQVVHTDVYAFRNGQFNKDRRREQHMSSKLAEFAVYQFFQSKNIHVTEPDLSIKSRGNKSWDPDIEINNQKIPIHVKSREVKMAEKYGLSWIGEKTDKKLYKEPEGYLALCLVEDKLVKIYTFIESKFVKESGFFREPKLKKHREKKFAIYYEDIEKQSRENRWKLLYDLLPRR